MGDAKPEAKAEKPKEGKKMGAGKAKKNEEKRRPMHKGTSPSRQKSGGLKTRKGRKTRTYVCTCVDVCIDNNREREREREFY
jgi:hypothetical protein